MRIIGYGLIAIAALSLAACQAAEEPAAAPAAAAAEADPQPSQVMQETFGANCTWGKVEGATMSIWSYACPAYDNARLVADDSLPGFVMAGTQDGVENTRPVIIAFKKAADAPVESIVAAVRARSPGDHSAECVLTPATYPGAPAGRYGFEPVGEVKARWDAFSGGAADAEPIDPPCGELGPHMSGDHSFQVMTDDPTTVLYIDFGSEIQLFDVDTLRSKTAG